MGKNDFHWEQKRPNLLLMAAEQRHWEQAFTTEHTVSAARMSASEDIVLFSCASDSERRLEEGALRPTLIEPVDDVTGAAGACKRRSLAKSSEGAVKRTALRKAPSSEALILPYSAPYFSGNSGQERSMQDSSSRLTRPRQIFSAASSAIARWWSP